ncbi:MAG: hypothetical protein KDA84_16525 [Planctomycetaceae bacterium]|nr:hypothetical protein [Planctomycetaceae bacterium]
MLKHAGHGAFNNGCQFRGRDVVPQQSTGDCVQDGDFLISLQLIEDGNVNCEVIRPEEINDRAGECHEEPSLGTLQNAQTLDWMIEEFKQPPRDSGDKVPFAIVLSQVLAQAPPELLSSRQRDIEQLAGIDLTFQDRIARRVRFFQMAHERILAEEDDPEFLDLPEDVLAIAEGLGLWFPEDEQWKENIKQGRKRFRSGWDDAAPQDEGDEWDLEKDDIQPSTTIVNEQPKVGRNDP